MEIIPQNCIGCGYCSLVCKNDAISRDESMIMKITSRQCKDCTICQAYCPTEAIVSPGGEK